MRRALLLVLAVLAPSAVPAEALAGTVTSTGAELRFTAAPDEVNNVSVRSAPGELVLRDTGAPLTAGAGCAQSAPGEVRCAVADRYSAIVDGGDGPDVLDARGEDVVLLGGSGDDELIGGEMADSSCGAGSGDVFAPADPGRIPPRTNGCERVRLTGRLLVGPILGWGAEGVQFGAFTVARRASFRVVLRHRGVRVGSRRVTLRGPGRGGFTVRMNRTGRRLIERSGWLTVLVRRPGRTTVGFRVYLVS